MCSNSRKYFFLILLIPVVFGCGPKQSSPTDIVNIPASAGEGVNKEDLPEIKFEEEVFDFGTITQGEKVSHEFRFTNEGASDLILSNAYADCGCTVPEVPKRPIPAGEGDKIKVTFDSDRKSGLVTKEITVLTNCIPNKRKVKIKVNIFVPQTQTPAKQ